jgi:hypothetical protein
MRTAAFQSPPLTSLMIAPASYVAMFCAVIGRRPYYLPTTIWETRRAYRKRLVDDGSGMFRTAGYTFWTIGQDTNWADKDTRLSTSDAIAPRMSHWNVNVLLVIGPGKCRGLTTGGSSVLITLVRLQRGAPELDMEGVIVVVGRPQQRERRVQQAQTLEQAVSPPLPPPGPRGMTIYSLKINVKIRSTQHAGYRRGPRST